MDNPNDTPNTPPTPPPAALTVATGPETEEVSTLKQQLEAERQARKKAETDAAYAQDTLRQLKEVQTNPAPQPKPKKSKWTFFDEEED